MIPLIYQDEVVSISKWIPITKAYKYEMMPSRNQEVKMNQTLRWKDGGWNVQHNDQQDSRAG